MGAPKQKWTAEEEAALRAGVEKYGPGKWRAIQKDSKFGPCLTSRSNVDLKDKWRNMSVSANGVGSARERSKPLAITGPGMMTLMEEAVAVDPLASIAPGDVSSDGKHGDMSNSSDRKSLGPRYDDMVLEAVLGMKEPHGSSNASIASYIEERHPVPTNFRRLLTTKLKSLTLQGKLLKVRQNYKINEGKENPVAALETAEETESPASGGDGRPPKGSRLLRRQEVHSDESNKPRTPRFPRDPTKKLRGEPPHKKVKMDMEHVAKARARTADEAARAAAIAVAEAEAAAAAAEQAARAAEAAEAEAEAMEAAAEAALAAVRPPKKSVRAVAVTQEVAVNG